jgi:hypothetical protein
MRAGMLVLVAACGSSSPSDPPPVSTDCADHPLETGLTAIQTGISVDSFDCEILDASDKYAEPDPMLFKAIIYTESRFDYSSIGCTNLPCGQPDGWSIDEAGCLGVMQIVPACGGTPGDIGLLPNGHPNMELDTSAAAFGTSIFKPAINIEVGIAGLAGNRDEVEGLFPGCTEDQYTLMALSNYGNHGSAQGCTIINHDHVDSVLEAYREYATAAGYAPRPY